MMASGISSIKPCHSALRAHQYPSFTRWATYNKGQIFYLFRSWVGQEGRLEIPEEFKGCLPQVSSLPLNFSYSQPSMICGEGSSWTLTAKPWPSARPLPTPHPACPGQLPQQFSTPNALNHPCPPEIACMVTALREGREV